MMLDGVDEQGLLICNGIFHVYLPHDVDCKQYFNIAYLVEQFRPIVLHLL